MGHEGDAPGWFEVVFEVALRGQASRSKDSSQFTVRVHPDWAPLGAARFKELVEQGFYDDSGVFQVLRGVVAAFGLPAKPQPELMRIADDNATHPNVRGTLSFTRERSSKIVINLADNNFLNNKGFAPFGEVMADGMTVVERFYSGNKDDVDERRLTAEGNAYLDEAFPLTTKIVKVFVKPPEAPVAPRPKAEAPAKKEEAPAQKVEAPAQKEEAPAKEEEAPAKREAQCLPVAEGTECYKEVTWALEQGVQEHPDWYPGLTASSSREDFQALINKEKPTVCPTPCAAARKEAQCLPVVEGTECYKEVTWAMEQGVQEHPAWYPGLTASSSREDFQAFINKEKPAVCPTPCAAARKEAQCLSVVEGTECYKEVTWAMEQGVQEHPAWYPGLTASSSREDFQAFINKEKPAVCPTPCAAARKEAQCLPVVEGTECYKEVTWAMEQGVQEHPAWYPGLTASSSREDFQALIHKEKPAVCPTPCAAAVK